MQAATQETGPSARPMGEHTLDSLSEMTSEALRDVYAGGRVTPLQALVGNPRGRMLAVRGADRGSVGGWLRRFAGGSGFPWGGKSFLASGDVVSGVNRVHLFGRHHLFPFHLREQASAIDGKPCIFLEYDLADNPALIRKIHDEVREVSPGLYLGPAMWKSASGPALVLWFALDTADQAVAVGSA